MDWSAFGTQESGDNHNMAMEEGSGHGLLPPPQQQGVTRHRRTFSGPAHLVNSEHQQPQPQVPGANIEQLASYHRNLIINNFTYNEQSDEFVPVFPYNLRSRDHQPQPQQQGQAGHLGAGANDSRLYSHNSLPLASHGVVLGLPGMIEREGPVRTNLPGRGMLGRGVGGHSDPVQYNQAGIEPPAHLTRSAARRQQSQPMFMSTFPPAGDSNNERDNAPQQPSLGQRYALRQQQELERQAQLQQQQQQGLMMPPPPVPQFDNNGAPNTRANARATSAPRRNQQQGQATVGQQVTQGGAGPGNVERTPQSSPSRGMRLPPDQYAVYLSAKKPRNVGPGGTLALFDNSMSVSTSSSGAAAH